METDTGANQYQLATAADNEARTTADNTWGRGVASAHAMHLRSKLIFLVVDLSTLTLQHTGKDTGNLFCKT